MKEAKERYLGYLKPYLPIIILGIILSALFGAMGGILPLMAGDASQKIYEAASAGQDFKQLLLLASVLPMLFLVRGLLGFTGTMILTYASLKFSEALKADLFRAMQEAPVAFFDRWQTGDLLTRLNGDSSILTNKILEITKNIIRQPIQMLAAMIAIISELHKAGELLTFLVGLIIIPMIIIPVRIIAMHLKRLHQTHLEINSSVTQAVTQNLSGTREIRAFNQQNSQITRYHEKLKDYRRNFIRLFGYDLLSQPYMEVIGGLLLGFFYVYFLYQGHEFKLMVTVGLAAYLALDPVKRLAKLYNELVTIQPPIDRLEIFFEEQRVNSERSEAKDLPDIRGDVVFNNVTFAYQDRPALDAVSVQVKAGETIALVGPSGAGKSTFVNLLLGFYKPQSGTICFDGHDINKHSRHSLRERVAFVPQLPTLFDETVSSNIALGKDGASEAEIEQAAKKAFAHEFIMQLPDGYQTRIGERGERLSGGQIQRLAVARAFLREAQIVVLDEATSALDTESEHKIKEALEVLGQGKTVFIVAHRFSTISQADRILVFEQGKIIAEGNHEQLYGSNTLYTSLFDKQSGQSE